MNFKKMFVIGLKVAGDGDLRTGIVDTLPVELQTVRLRAANVPGLDGRLYTDGDRLLRYVHGLHRMLRCHHGKSSSPHPGNHQSANQTQF